MPLLFFIIHHFPTIFLMPRLFQLFQAQELSIAQAKEYFRLIATSSHHYFLLFYHFQHFIPTLSYEFLNFYLNCRVLYSTQELIHYFFQVIYLESKPLVLFILPSSIEHLH